MNDNDRVSFWHRWLLVASAVVAGIGGMLVVLALVGVPSAMMELLYVPGEPDVASADTISFAIGVTGAVMAGWGISMLLVYLDPAMARQRHVARAFALAALAWFALDCAVSVAAGAMINVAGNVVFLGLLLPPLAALSIRQDRDPDSEN